MYDSLLDLGFNSEGERIGDQSQDHGKGVKMEVIEKVKVFNLFVDMLFCFIVVLGAGYIGTSSHWVSDE